MMKRKNKNYTNNNINNDNYGKLDKLFDKSNKKSSITYQIGFIYALFHNYIDQIMTLYVKIGKSSQIN